VLYGGESAANRLKTSAVVLTEIMATPDNGIPEELLEKSQCIVIVPGIKKAAFIVGGQYGKGFITCRPASGAGWSAPAAIKVEGGSFGFQIGGSETDAIMLVNEQAGRQKALSSKFTLGVDASWQPDPWAAVRRQYRSQDASRDSDLLALARRVCGVATGRRHSPAG